MDFPSAAISAPPINYPDIIGSLVRGQMAGAQMQMLPGQLQEQQNSLAQQGLNLDQLRLAMRTMQMRQTLAANNIPGLEGYAAPNGTAAAGAQSGASSSGGIQNGPQGAVSGAGGTLTGPAQASGSFNGSYSSAPRGTDSQTSQYDPNNPLAYWTDPRRLAANIPMAQFGAYMSGGDPNKPVADALKIQSDAREDAIKKAQLAAEIPGPGNPMPMLKSFAGMTPEHAAATLAAPGNEGILAMWPKVAQKYNVDPFDKTQIPVIAAMEYNQRGAPLQLSVPVPAQIRNVNLGQGEVAQIDQTGKKVGDLVERQTPTFTLVDVPDPAAPNRTRKVPVQTGGYGMQGVGPTGNVVGAGPRSASQFPTSAAGLGVDIGFKPPTDPELKAAMFASEMRSGMQTLNQLEGQGFSLSPAQRTAFINAATSEEPGAVKQFFSQEYLSKLSPQTQTYMAALMPMLQAAGHDQSGARLTTSQVRQNIESLLPIDVRNGQALNQVQQNRQGFYTGLLTQAGSATRLPQYQNSLGSDLDAQQSAARVPTLTPEQARAAPKGTRFRSTDGRILVTR